MNFDLSSLDKLSQTQTTAKTSKFAPTARARPVCNPFLSFLAAMSCLPTSQNPTLVCKGVVVPYVSRSGQLRAHLPMRKSLRQGAPMPMNLKLLVLEVSSWVFFTLALTEVQSRLHYATRHPDKV